MRILLLSTERGWGGGEEQLRLLAAGLVAQGHDCQVACRVGSEFLQRSQGASHQAFALPGHPRGWRAVWTIRRLLARQPFDVIHANDAHAVTLMRSATWGARAPVQIASRRVIFPIRSTGRYRRAADRVLCVSEAIRRVAVDSGIPREQTAVVYDGVDFTRAASGDRNRGRQQLGVADSTPVILVVASLQECKGHRHLVDAVPTILRSVPAARIFLAGEGAERPALEAQIAQLGLAGTIQLLGFRRDVPDLLQASDLVVLPSLDEGLGSSAIDALGIARPVVATTSGGLPEVLKSSLDAEPHGWLVPPGDSDALAGAICTALSDPGEAARRAAQGQAFVRARFDQRAMVAATLAEYARVFAEHQRST